MTERDRMSEDLKAYLDNELPLLRRIAVRRHLAACAACREELKQMTQVAEHLRGEAAQEMGASKAIDPELRAKVLDNYTAPLPPTDWRAAARKRRTMERLTAACAVSIVVIGGIKLVGNALNPGMSKLNSVSASIMNSDGPDIQPPSSTETHPIAQAVATAPIPAANSQPIQQFPITKSAGIKSISLNNAAPSDDSRRVHKEASITVEVGDPEGKGDAIEAMVKDVGGFVATNTLETDDNGLRTAELTVKVPVAQFETILGEVAHLGTVKAKNLSGEDITEKVSDADQRQGILSDEANRAEARLAKLGKHAKWDDAETARDLRIQVAQARARLRLLKKLGELSDISITLTEKPKTPAPASVGFWSGMSDTSHNAFGSLLGSTSVLLTGIIWLVVYSPIWVLLLIGGRWAYRRYVGEEQRPAV